MKKILTFLGQNWREIMVLVMFIYLSAQVSEAQKYAEYAYDSASEAASQARNAYYSADEAASNAEDAAMYASECAY